MIFGNELFNLQIKNTTTDSQRISLWFSMCFYQTFLFKTKYVASKIKSEAKQAAFCMWTNTHFPP